MRILKLRAVNVSRVTEVTVCLGLKLRTGPAQLLFRSFHTVLFTTFDNPRNCQGENLYIM